MGKEERENRGKNKAEAGKGRTDADKPEKREWLFRVDYLEIIVEVLTCTTEV